MTLFALIMGTALSAEPVKLDVGPYGSELLPGYQRLSPHQTDDSRIAYHGTPKVVRNEARPDPLAGDAVIGGVLDVHLETGTWTVRMLTGGAPRGQIPAELPGSLGVTENARWLLEVEVPAGWSFFGSEYYAQHPFPVFRHGETEWDRQIQHAHRWLTFNYTSDGKPTQWEVRGTPLRAILAHPADQQAASAVDLATTQAQRRDWYHHRVQRAAENAPLPANEAGGLRLMSAGWRQIPDPKLATPTLLIQRAMSPGERSSVVIWLYGFSEDATIELPATPKLTLTARQAHWLDDEGAVYRDRRPRPSFVRSIDGGRLIGGQGTPIGIVLDIDVPNDASPMDHQLPITVQSDEGSVEFQVHIRVRALELQSPGTHFGFYYDMRTPVVAVHGTMSPPVLDVTGRDLDIMRERGIDTIVARRMTPWPNHGSGPANWPWGKDEDTSVFETVAEMWRERGGGPIFWLDSMYVTETAVVRNHKLPILSEASGARLERLASAAARASDTALYLSDEAGIRHGNAGERLFEMLSAVRDRLGNGARLAAAIPHPSDWPAASLLDIVVLFRTPNIDPRWPDRMRAVGAEPWAYSLGIGRDMTGIIAYGYGVEGMLHWHWNDFKHDPFLRTAKWNGEYTFLGPGGEIFPTVLLESYAEGIIDHRYLRTLEVSVATLQCSSSSRLRGEALQGQRMLEAIRGAVQGSKATGPYEGNAWSDDQLALMRRAVGDEAERIEPWVQKLRQKGVGTTCETQ